MNFWRFDLQDPSLGPLLEGSYDPLLVTLSIMIGCFAGVTAMALADRMTAAVQPSAKAWWLLGGSVAMGCGIWALHFTGMLAFSVHQYPHVDYDAGITILSLFPAVLGSAAALYFIARVKLKGLRIHVCALLLALGIGTMHYSGMEAMQMKGLRYDFLLFVLSIGVAYLLALAALATRSILRSLRTLPETGISLIAGAILGLAVAAMHYTAMRASRFHEIADMSAHGSVFSDTTLAISISAFAALILGLSVMATWIDRQIGLQRLLQLEKMAYTDGLTGLPNRLLFQDQLQAAQEQSRRHGDRFALLFIDLDKFKPVNDTYGHAVGDRLLKEVASRIQAVLREEDVVARVGGDEFLVLIRDLNLAEEAMDVVERLQAQFAIPAEFNEKIFVISVSIGISIFPDDGDNVEELKQQADAAMYRAKANALGYCFYDKSLSNRAIERARLGSDLREALEREESFFHYQPWVDLQSGQCLGVEALARWVHPKEGDISPEVFVPLAERSGLIQKFGEWSLRQVCLQGRHWLGEGVDFGCIAVNISAQHFMRDDFVVVLRRILEETGFPGGRLELELTEACFEELATAEKHLLELRQLNVTVVLDEFGKGSMFLGKLTQLSIDKLKIDRSLVTSICEDGRSTAIVKAIVEMSAGLGVQVVAAGIETSQQRELIAGMGCRLGQGYLFSRPLSVKDLEQRLLQQEMSDS